MVKDCMKVFFWSVIFRCRQVDRTSWIKRFREEKDDNDGAESDEGNGNVIHVPPGVIDAYKTVNNGTECDAER